MTHKTPDKETLKLMVTVNTPSKNKYKIYMDPFGRYYLYKLEKNKEVYTKHTTMNPLELEAKYCK